MSEDLSLLIVEDDAMLRQQIAQLVATWGYQVRLADSGEAAMDALTAAPPDVLLTDMILPNSGGAQVLAFARDHSPHLPILVMTAYASLESAISALKQGAYDYLLKPITPAELEAALKRASGAVQLQRSQEREAQLRQVTALTLTLAHEINNPLGIIMGELQLQLETGQPMPPERLKICLEASRRIAATVRNLTELRDITYERYEGLELLQLEVRG